MTNKRYRVGLLGSGAIAPAYLRNLTGDLSNLVDVQVCADLDRELASKRAEEFGIARAVGPDELLCDPEIDLIINLTPAPLHFRTSLSILEAGKHLFSEKPLCMDLAEGRQLLETAEKRGLRIAGAADTFLGGAFHLCSKLIADDAIGTPITAQAFLSVPMFDSLRYHKVFSGALLDLGPYYLTVLVMLFGSATKVSGLADIRFPERTDGKTGESFKLDRASTVVASVAFESGLVATVTASEDVYGYLPSIEVFGRKGRLKLSDANYYGDAVQLESYQETRRISASSDYGYIAKGRGLGVAEMALALGEGREPRSSGALMYHALEIMKAVYDSSKSGTAVSIESKAPAFRPLSEEELGQILGKGKEAKQ